MKPILYTTPGMSHLDTWESITHAIITGMCNLDVLDSLMLKLTIYK